MKKVEFREIPISSLYGNKIYRIFFVTEDGKSKMMNNFSKLEEDCKDNIKDLISKIVTNENYRSDNIIWNLHNYNFGEIRPFPHRFFFFQKCGKNIIFFDYYLNKKKDSLDDEFYKRINRRKEKYENEFIRFIKSDR